jgi:hypothetical protein
LGRGSREFVGEQRVQPAEPPGLGRDLLLDGGPVRGLPLRVILKMWSEEFLF